MECCHYKQMESPQMKRQMENTDRGIPGRCRDDLLLVASCPSHSPWCPQCELQPLSPHIYLVAPLSVTSKEMMKSLLITLGALAWMLLVLVREGRSDDCAPDFCDRVKMKCREPDCPRGHVYSARGAGHCDCCPSCKEQTRCPPVSPKSDACATVKLACEDTSSCPVGFTLHNKGAGYCGCCPACIKD